MIFNKVCIVPRINCEPDLFYEVDSGVVYPLVPIPKGARLELGRPIPVTGMLDLTELMLGTKRAAYFFRSSFTMEARGGYLVTYLKNKGEAVAHEVVLRLDNLIIYNFPNRGTMAVSPKVTEAMAKILESQ